MGQGRGAYSAVEGSAELPLEQDTPSYTEARHQELRTDMLMSPGCWTES